MIEKFDDLLFNLLLILTIWGLNIFIFLIIKEPQIVLIYHPYPENILLFPKKIIWLIPIVFSFLIVYNFILRFIDIKKQEINKINFLIFLFAIFTQLYLFFINF